MRAGAASDLLSGGPVLSETVARLLLLEHRQSQSPFVVPEVLVSGHALVARLTARLEKSLPRIPPISQPARELCVSVQTLGRPVRRATGKSTGCPLYTPRCV